MLGGIHEENRVQEFDAPQPRGPWQVLRTFEAYRDPWVQVTRDDVIRPDGQVGTHSIIRFKEGVSVLPLDAEGYVYLTDEFHYAVGRNGIEVISGGIESDETPLAAAARELQEEVGLAASLWTQLGVTDPFTTGAVAPVLLFLAQKLRQVEASPEGTETIRRVRVPFEKAVEMVMASEITHAPSCVLILKAARHLEKQA